MDRMKHILLTVSLLFVSVFAAGCQNANANADIAERIKSSDEPVITWGTKADTNLYGQYDIADREIVGFDVDIAKAITDIITDGKGKAEFVEVTSKTRVPLLVNGNIDAIIATMTISESRLDAVTFSDTYFSGGQSLLVPENSEINSIDDLDSSNTVLAVKGSNSTQTFRRMRPDIPVLDMENYAEAFVALQAGQGDALTTDNAILLGIIDQNPGYRLAGENFTREPYGIAIGKGQDGFRDQVDEALDELIANGGYKEIFDKWFGDLLPNDQLPEDLLDADAWVAKNVYVPYYEENPDAKRDDATGDAASLRAMDKTTTEKEGE